MPAQVCRPRRGFSVFRVFLVPLVLAFSVACESTAPDEDGDSVDGNIQLTDDNNYQSVSDLSIPVVDTVSGTDFDICWDEVDSDIQCHDVDPMADIDNVALLRFLNLSKEEVENILVSDYLSMSDLAGYASVEPGNQSTCVKLSDFTVFGSEFDHENVYVDDEEYTYMLLFTSGTIPGVGARTMLFVNPLESETNTTAEAVPGCERLSFEVDLSSGDTVAIPEDGPWLVDWNELTRDGGGSDVEQADIDGVLIGFYEGLTVADLEEQIFDLEQIYTNLWEVEVERGRSADLADATERDTGDAFPGFERDEEGTWILGLTCSTCSNPAPILLTIVNPVSE